MMDLTGLPLFNFPPSTFYLKAIAIPHGAGEVGCDSSIVGFPDAD